MRDLQSQTKYLEQSKKNPVKLDRIRRGCYYFWGEDWALGYIPLEFNIFLIFSYLLWPSVLGPFRGSWAIRVPGLLYWILGVALRAHFGLAQKCWKFSGGGCPGPGGWGGACSGSLNFGLWRGWLCWCFWLPLSGFGLWGGLGAGLSSPKFDIFLIIPNLLRFYVLIYSATCEATCVYKDIKCHFTCGYSDLY